jgi:hypothetical protein
MVQTELEHKGARSELMQRRSNRPVLPDIEPLGGGFTCQTPDVSVYVIYVGNIHGNHWQMKRDKRVHNSHETAGLHSETGTQGLMPLQHLIERLFERASLQGAVDSDGCGNGIYGASDIEFSQHIHTLLRQ